MFDPTTHEKKLQYNQLDNRVSIILPVNNTVGREGGKGRLEEGRGGKEREEEREGGAHLYVSSLSPDVVWYQEW